jgi:hypothetical protein
MRAVKALDEAYIYILVDPREGIPRYVGKTLSPEQRMAEHKAHSTTKDKSSEKGAWIARLQGVGVQPFMVLIDKCKRSQEKDREAYWIAHFESLGVKLFNMIKK